MSMRTEMRLCIKCGRVYGFDPTAGKFGCPYCHYSIQRIGNEGLRKALKKLLEIGKDFGSLDKR